MELKPAKIVIQTFEITDYAGDEAAFAVSVSAGGYVRSIAHELGQDLGCGAHLSSLRRTRAGVFTLADAHTLEELELLAGDAAGLEAMGVHPRCLLTEMPSVTSDAMTLGGGCPEWRAEANLPEFSQAALVKVFAGQRDLVGIAEASWRNAVSASDCDGGGAEGQWSVTRPLIFLTRSSTLAGSMKISSKPCWR